jgi:TonB family protein
MFCTRVVFFAGFTAVLAGTSGFAQESLQAAKDLYASAAYEDALGIFTRLQATDPKPEVEQYRVSCLIALGRTSEATKAVETVVSTNPGYAPDPAEVSPRVQELFARTRKQLLPDIARRMYVDAKAAFDRKDRNAAVSKFEELVKLVDSTDEGIIPELRVLAMGFLDLSRALPSAEAQKAPVVESPRPARARDITPPVAIRQAMPAWIPPDGVSRQTSFNGAVRVAISATGRVESAAIVRPVHPVYDRLLLQAAKSWEYQPARSDGVAVASEQLVQVQLKPGQ